MQELRYERNKNVIRDLELGTKEEYSSINQAKRMSRKIQGNRLGQGLLRVVKHKTTVKAKKVIGLATVPYKKRRPYTNRRRRPKNDM